MILIIYQDKVYMQNSLEKQPTETKGRNKKQQIIDSY